MLRLPRTLLDPEVAGGYCVDGQVSISTTRDCVILDPTGEDEAGEWVEDAEDSLSAIVGVRSELAAGDLRPPAASAGTPAVRQVRDDRLDRRARA